MEWLNLVAFSRPWAFLLLPLGLVAVYTMHLQSQSHQYHHHKAKRLFSDELLRYLSTSSSKSKSGILRFGNYLGVISLVIALTGPSIPKHDNNAFKMNRGVVFVFDLSLSMLATDLAPNRLTQAKFMFRDLLAAVPNVDAGLIVYADYAYPIVPITQSHSLLTDQIPLLHPDVMPGQGSKPLSAIQLATKMLTQSGYIEGEIVWITDDVAPNISQRITDVLPHRLSALVFGSLLGATIRLSDQSLLKNASGSAILHAVPSREVDELSNAANGIVQRIQQAQMPPIALINLLQEAQHNAANGRDSTQSHSTDIGIYLLMPVLVIIFVACYQRARPMYFSGALFAAIYMLPTNFAPVFASTSAMELFHRGEYALAAKQANDPRWQAQALMKLGDFETAIQLLNTFNDPVSQYNLALCYTEEKNFEEAIRAFENAISLKPNFIEAEENRQALLTYLQNQQGDEQGNQGSEEPQTDGNNPSQSKSKNDDNNSPNSEQAPSQQISNESSLSSQEKQSSQQSFASTEQNAEQQTREDKSPEKQPSQNENEQNLNSERKSTSEQKNLSGGNAVQKQRQAQYINALIDRVPNEPAFLLKRRLQIMHQAHLQNREQTRSVNSEEQW